MDPNYFNILKKTRLEESVLSILRLPYYKSLEELNKRSLNAFRRFEMPFKSAASELQEKMKSHEAYFKNVLSGFDVHKRIIEDRLIYLPDFPNLMSSLAIQGIGNQLHIKSLDQMGKDITKLAQTLERSPHFDKSLLGQVSKSLKKISSEINDTVLTTTIQDVKSSFTNKLIQTEPNTLSYEAKFQIFIAIILFLLALLSDKISERNIISSIESLREELLPKIEKLKPSTLKKDLEHLYFSRCYLNVRLKPRINSLKIELLYPNQIVKMVKINKKWAYIEYYDYVEDLPKVGWVFKKHLKKIYLLVK